MSEHVHLPDATFNHARLHLSPPNGLQGGAYFAMMYYNDAPLYIQTPKCTSRQAVVPGKRPYIDLMFSSHDVSFLEWLEALEADAVRLIYDKRNMWFSSDLEKSDIEAGFTSPVRPYKGGKHYLIRAYIQPTKHLAGTSSCSVFDENERPVSVDHIKAENQMYAVLEFQGIKFTSRSFQLEVALKQVLLVSNVPIFQSCVIRKPHASIAPIPKTATNTITASSVEQGIEESAHPAQLESAHPAQQLEESTHPAQLEESAHPAQLEESAHQEPTQVSAQPLKQNQSNKSNVTELGTNVTITDSIQIQEVNLDVLEELEHMHIKLKKPTEVYYNMYRNAKQKAKELKKNAVAAYLEAKQIKSAHMLEDSDSNSNSDIEYSDSDNE